MNSSLWPEHRIGEALGAKYATFDGQGFAMTPVTVPYEEAMALCKRIAADYEQVICELSAYWPQMPDLEGNDIFLEKYGPPSGLEG